MKIPLPAKLRNESEETLARTYGNTGQREEKSTVTRPTTTPNKELSIYINFIDEDGEILQVKAMPDELTSQVMNRYVCLQGTPFLLSGGLYGFKYNGKVVPFDATIESMGICAGDDNTI